MIAVIDANLAIFAVLPTVAPRDTVDWFIRWRRNQIRLVAPALWLPECTSAIRRYVYTGILSPEEALTAIEDLFELEVEILPTMAERCRNALTWAARLQQSRAYDSFYLALADELNATF